METNPIVSIIIPAHNSEQYVQNAIDSTYRQGVDRFEVIVVDDGSTDNTLAILKSNQSNPNFSYYTQANQGPSAARNLGLKQAKGKYICFLDADDQLEENSIAERFNALEQHKAVDLIFTDVIRLDNKDKPGFAFLKKHDFLKKFKEAIESNQGDIYFFNDKYFDCAIKYFPFIWTSSVMIRADVIQKVGLFNERYNASEDVDYWLKIARAGKVAYIDKPLTSWHHYFSTLTRPENYNFYINTIDCYQAIKKTLGNKQYLKPFINKRLSYYAFAGGYEAINVNALKDARRFFFKACWFKPTKLKYWLYALASLMPKSMFYRLRSLKQANQGV